MNLEMRRLGAACTTHGSFRRKNQLITVRKRCQDPAIAEYGFQPEIGMAEGDGVEIFAVELRDGEIGLSASA